MEENVIITKLQIIFREVFSDESIIINKEISANDIDHWNSLNHMILITEIESVLSIKFRLKDLNRMKNVGDMIDIIISKL